MCGKQNCVVNTDWISRISLWTAWRQKQSKQKDTNKFMPVFIIEVQIQLSCDFCYFGQFVNGGFLKLFCFQSNFVKLIINQDCLPVCLSWYNANMLNIPSCSKSLKKEEDTTKNRLMVAFDSNKGPNLKVVKWCWKGWNGPILMHIYDKQCEIIQKNQWKNSNFQIQCFYKGTSGALCWKGRKT